MKFFFDCEFNEYVREGTNTIDLFTLAIVADEDASHREGKSLYMVFKDFNIEDAWDKYQIEDGQKVFWLRDNVLQPFFEQVCHQEEKERPFTKETLKEAVQEWGYTKEQAQKKIIEFIQPEKEDYVEFWGYYADYDWVVFCWIFGRMIDLPEGFPMFCHDIKQDMPSTFNKDDYEFKTLPDHTALTDTYYQRELYHFVQEHKRLQAKITKLI